MKYSYRKANNTGNKLNNMENSKNSNSSKKPGHKLKEIGENPKQTPKYGSERPPGSKQILVNSGAKLIVFVQ